MVKAISSCAICSLEFSYETGDRDGKYCSRNCFYKRTSKLKNNCSACNKEFYYREKERPNAEFCSKKCSGPIVAQRYSEKLKSRPLQEKINSLKIKFDKKVIKKDACWEWLGLKACHGYGTMVGIDNILMRAHRISFLIYNGSIPDGMNVLHSCDNPPCTNPKHLFLGTQKDNIMDMIQKGRSKFRGIYV